MKVPQESLNSELFQRRSAPFLVTTERGKRVVLRCGTLTQRLSTLTRRNGHFRGQVELSERDIESLASTGELDGNWVTLDIQLSPEDGRRFFGRAQLVEETGVSVISDIDDTIKESNVADQNKLLRNTFLGEFRAVEGMAELYSRWQDESAVFHYVSSSPAQLYQSLSEMLEYEGFPRGSIHLKVIRLRDPSVLQLFVARRFSKGRYIRRIINYFPDDALS